jgi:hypothetical protein
MGARQADMSATVANKGPAIQAATQSGVAQLQGQDELNAEEIGAVGASAGQGLSAGAGRRVVQGPGLRSL